VKQKYWMDAAGEVERGSAVTLFKPGDQVWYAAINRAVQQ